jgi:hypothetical protein
MKPTFRGLVTVCLWAALAAPAGAQVITSEPIDRGLRIGTYGPYEGVPYTQRYGYKTGAMFYLGGDARQLYSLDYLDRLDRAERFGYAPPAPRRFAPPMPAYSPHPPCDCVPTPIYTRRGPS